LADVQTSQFCAPLRASLEALAPAAIRLAEAEGLDAHALSLALRQRRK